MLDDDVEAEGETAMKYFTPKLLAKTRSDDPDVAERAAIQWERKAQAYRERLQEIRARLPRGAWRLIRSVSLHDAGLTAIDFASERGHSQLSLAFQLAGGGGRERVQLRYNGFEKLKSVIHDSEAPGDTKLFVLYDEFDISANGLITHSMLMTGDLEIQIQFASLGITRFKSFLAKGKERSDIPELGIVTGLLSTRNWTSKALAAS